MNKFVHVVLLVLLALAGAFGYANAALPTVNEVEQTISSGDYTKARAQLKEVLKANPDSLVANRYMLEIIKIEYARTLQPSVEYKLYEQKIADIEKAVTAKKIEAKRIADEKAAAERRAAIWNGFVTAVKWIMSVLFVVAMLVAAAMFVDKRKKHKAEQLRIAAEREAREEERKVLRTRLIDTNSRITTFKSSSEYPKFTKRLDGELEVMINALHDDNSDALRQLDDEDDDVDFRAVRRHLNNAEDFFNTWNIA